MGEAYNWGVSICLNHAAPRRRPRPLGILICGSVKVLNAFAPIALATRSRDSTTSMWVKSTLPPATVPASGTSTTGCSTTSSKESLLSTTVEGEGRCNCTNKFGRKVGSQIEGAAFEENSRDIVNKD